MTSLRFQVTDSDTAIALGSGDVPVLATPRLLAWLEAATVAAAGAELGLGQTSVGVEVAMKHLRASAVGASVRVEVAAVHREGRLLTFEVSAWDVPTATPQPIATATIVRAIVDREKFLARL